MEATIDVIITVIAVVLTIWIAYLTRLTAERRGRSGDRWMWWGVIFGPFAWLTVALLPSIRKESAVDAQPTKR